MHLRKPVLAQALALARSLAACGDDPDLQRGETTCDTGGREAADSQDASCEETRTPGDGGDGTRGDG